jgi:response regulator RpfG family c-di-GMP phosphodiesterase
MSGIDGSETTIQLRNKGLLMPIIILSANAYQADRLNAMAAGANDFLAKPVKVPHLLNKLKLHLALNWICPSDDIDLAGTSPEEPLLLPPADEIENLVHFVRIGDLLGLNKHLDELIKNQPEYQPFVSRVKALASEFRIAEIKKLLA